MENNVSDSQVGGNHYRNRKNQTWDMYECALNPDEFRGAMKSNIMKYTDRYQQKGGIQDLQKAEQYTRRLEEFESGVRNVIVKIDFSKKYSAADLLQIMVNAMDKLIEFELPWETPITKRKFLKND